MSDLLRERLQSSLGAAYTLERELGGGGMSRVFVARDNALARDVVVKVLSPELAQELSAERFAREVRLAAGLQEPHIVPVLAAGATADGLPYYTMPFVAGESLRARMSLGPVQPAEAVAMLCDVATALEYAHERGVVHRDIKPDNVLLSGRTAVVTDFGIAKALRAARTDATGGTLTQIGTSLGTPAYMAPEQAAGDPATDHRADLYAWGVMAYETLAGRHPFAHRTTPQALFTAHFVEVPAPLAGQCPGVAPQVAAIIMRCLEKDPDRRPAGAGELIAALSDRGWASGATTSQSARAAYTSTSTSESDKKSERSIVVLPFANLSADADNEYFSDGLTDELIADLSRVRALRVISRTSAMLLRGSDRSARQIAGELGVRYVLEGSVRRAGGNLRITARLVDAENDTQCWADKYTGTLDDVFDVQERVSREIVRALDVTLSSDEDRLLAERSIEDATAYDCYLRARHELVQGSGGSMDRATVLLKRGMDIVGDNSRLRATLAYVDVLRMRMAGHTDPAVLDAAAEQAFDILRRDPELGVAHFLLGTVEFERGRLQRAAASMQSALRADPNDADAGVWLGIVYLYAGQIAAARATFDRLRRQDPLSPFPLGLAGAVEWFDGNFAASIEPMARCLELSPESTLWRWQWGYALALNGRVAEAAEQAERLWRSDPANPYSRQLMVLTHALRGDVAEARRAIVPFDGAHFDPHMTFHVAECHVLTGDHARAIELVESAVARGFYPYAFIARHDPFLEALRTEPRFTDVVREAKRRWQERVA